MKPPLLYLLLTLSSAYSQQVGGEYKSTALYTSPDPAAKGGLHLTTSVPIQFAFAIAQSDQEHVYQGTLNGADVTFANLPVSRYDLLLVTALHFYHGISLNRGENSLTADDLKSIGAILDRSVPFFDQKRTEAVHGSDGKSAALVQWMRVGGRLLNQNGDDMTGHQIRSLRLAFLSNVGPGWQVTATRELIRTDVFPNMPKGFLPVAYVDSLNGIRVTDSVKDIGAIILP